MYIVRDEGSNKLFLYEKFPEKYIGADKKIRWRVKFCSAMELNKELFPEVDHLTPVKVKLTLDR